MNRVNLATSILVMERVLEESYHFDMSDWVDSQASAVSILVPGVPWLVVEEKALVKCGSAACFGGYLASSVEWMSQGGSNVHGVPWMDERTGADAIALFLGITSRKAHDLCATALVYSELGTHNSYGKRLEEISAEDVLEKLYKMKHS